jgi:hypothetical protein
MTQAWCKWITAIYQRIITWSYWQTMAPGMRLAVYPWGRAIYLKRAMPAWKATRLPRQPMMTASTAPQNFSGTMAPMAEVEVISSGEGFLSAWIDFNHDFDFADPGEQVITDCAVITGTQPITFTVTDATFPDMVFARFRLYSEDTHGTASPYGFGGLGEVEDYAWDFGATDIRLVQFKSNRVGLPTSLYLFLIGLLGVGGFTWWMRRRLIKRRPQQN